MIGVGHLYDVKTRSIVIYDCIIHPFIGHFYTQCCVIGSFVLFSTGQWELGIDIT